MFEDFIKDLESELKKRKIRNRSEILQEYRKKYGSLRAAGKSEFESVLTFGDPQTIADAFGDADTSPETLLEANLPETKKRESSPKEKPETRVGIYLSDAFYFAPSVLIAVCGIIALAFLSALCGGIGCAYTILSWMKFEAVAAKVCGFVLALMAIAMGAGGIYLTVRLGKGVYVGGKRYLRERKEKLSEIPNHEN